MSFSGLWARVADLFSSLLPPLFFLFLSLVNFRLCWRVATCTLLQFLTCIDLLQLFIEEVVWFFMFSWCFCISTLSFSFEEFQFYIFIVFFEGLNFWRLRCLGQRRRRTREEGTSRQRRSLRLRVVLSFPHYLSSPLYIIVKRLIDRLFPLLSFWTIFQTSGRPSLELRRHLPPVSFHLNSRKESSTSIRKKDS